MSEDTSFPSSFKSDPYLAVVATLIVVLNTWGATFSHSCSSDGCIGIFIPLGASTILLILQLVICLPVLAVRWRRHEKPVAEVLLGWAVLSIVCFALPLAFMK